MRTPKALLVVLALHLLTWAPSAPLQAQASRPEAEAEARFSFPVTRAPEHLQAEALREHALDVLARRGPADLALAQLTRAALLDPDAPETWQALESSSARLDSTPRTWEARARTWAVRAADRVRDAATGLLRAGRLQAERAQVWWIRQGLPAVPWLPLAGLSLALASVAVWFLRPRRRVAAPAGRGAPSTAPPSRTGRVGQHGGQPTVRPAPGPPAAGRRSADEAALVAWLEAQDTGPGEPSDTGILARA